MEENIEDDTFIQKHLVSIEQFFKDCKKITLSNNELKQFLNGVKIPCNIEDGLCAVYSSDGIQTMQKKFIGIAEVKDNKLKRDVII